MAKLKKKKWKMKTMEIESAKTKKWEDQKWNMETWRIRGVGREREPLPRGGLFGRFGGFDVSSKHLHTKRHKTSADLRSAYEGPWPVDILAQASSSNIFAPQVLARISAVYPAKNPLF